MAQQRHLFKLCLVGVCMLFALVGLPASAGTVPSKHTGVSLLLGPGSVTGGETDIAFAPEAPVVVAVSFNGQQPQMVWADSRFEIEAAWHGVLVTVSGERKTAPLTIRAASVRRGVVRVFVRIVYGGGRP